MKKLLAEDPISVSSSTLVLSSILFSFIIVAAIIAWAMLSEVDKTTTATGTINQLSKNQIVQHLDGGTVESILVANGDHVRIGQPLLKLRPEAANAELEQLYTNVLAAKLDLVHWNENLNKAKARINRLTLTANEDGYIQGLKLGVGAMIRPGENILEIVPSNQQLIAEVRLSANDIDKIKIGDLVTIKVPSYHFTIHGSLPGRISSVENHTATITLAKQYLGNDPTSNLLLPGMIVTTEIITGKQSLLAYMLQPVIAKDNV